MNASDKAVQANEATKEERQEGLPIDGSTPSRIPPTEREKTGRQRQRGPISPPPLEDGFERQER